MKFRRLSSALSLFIFGGLLLTCAASTAKQIRLQNEIIDTGRAAANVEPSSGAAHGRALALIQFKETPSAEVRNDLAAHGVELLAAVPEDAFIARLRGAAYGWARSQSFVEWIGPYKPEHKLHPRLRSVITASDTPLEIKVLVAPRSDESEKRAVRDLLGKVDQESDLPIGLILKGKLSAGNLKRLQASEAVVWIEPTRDMKLFDEVASKLVGGDGGPNQLLTQSLGYDGSGVRVAVADSGLNNGDSASMHPDLLGRTPAFFFYGTAGHLFDASDGHSHGTHVAGIIAGNGATGETDENGALYGLGVAPGASIIGQRIFDESGGYAPPPSFERLTRDAKGAGAEIGSNSWGDDTYGAYDLSAMEFDALVRDCDALTPGDQPYILEFSAGNAGPAEGTIGSPAVAKNVIATGASQNDRTDFLIYGDGIETMADFSSRGPCLDGRIKPDVVAPGTYIASLQSASATDQYAWAPISPYYQYQGGTSQAGPHASGAAAVFVQYYRQNFGGATPSPALVKAALINSAVDLWDEFGTGPVPNNDEGWGRIDLPALLDPLLGHDYMDQAQPLSQGQVYERRVIAASADQWLKISMTYSDTPAVPSAAAALVNDLDLEIVAPDGTIYRGNQFAAGLSVANATGNDRINNVEGVLIADPIPGEYIVRVRAHKVMQDARRETGAIDQDFALVIAGDLAKPRQGVVSLDRSVYRSLDSARIFLVDPDLAGAPSATVRITSGTEPAGESVLLLANGAFGSFTGAVQVATGPAAADGKLQVADGQTITVAYNDAVPNGVRTASAIIDLLAPSLTAVSHKVSFGRPVVHWQTSEPATTIVRFGTNTASLNQAVTNLDLVDIHEISLPGVIQGVTYYYYVVSADQAGNYGTNNNGGAYFTFNINATTPLLLVDAWEDDPNYAGATPLSGYTNALDQLGVPYDVWRVATQGSPASVLPGYRAVIFRVPELVNILTVADRLAISNYLQTGGSVLIASMDLLSRLTEIPDLGFIKNVLHVESFISDEAGAEGVLDIYGEDLDPVMQGFSTDLDYTPYDLLWEPYMGLLPSDISDTIFPDNQASTILFDGQGDAVGLRWPGLGKQGPGKLVMLSFPLDAVPLDGTSNARVALLQKLLGFLMPGASPGALLQFDSTAYRAPGTATLELGDRDLATQSSVTATVKSTSQPAGITITLTRVAAGNFRGQVQLVSPSTTPAGGQIRAANGDTLTAVYTDPQGGAAHTATAIVDTVPVTISFVETEADYLDAYVWWETSEPADSLVIFGESPLLGRSAYTASLETSHEVVLRSLSPEKTYYFKVASRDAAGNVAEQDNAAQLFTFTTRTPLRPPWLDNMETGATNWSTYSDAEVGVGNWELGVPSNGLEPNPGSTTSWGSNLQGVSMDSAESFLISPAIYVPAGQSATLTFRHNYEFNDYSGFDLEFGALQISVDNGPLQDVSSYFDMSFGWEDEVVDLTPYAGRMIVLAWHYALLGFEAGPRPGWLVDDVHITTASTVPGVLSVSNNIFQAEYVISGPVYKIGRGPATVISNAPPGDYLIEFATVPFYQKPANLSLTLPQAGKLHVRGDYTFTDTNSNGIPDPAEISLFGEVSPGRTAQTDSDYDSTSDFLEIIAGTDPRNAGPGLRVFSAQPGASNIRLGFASMGATYKVEKSLDLTNWVAVATGAMSTNLSTFVSVPRTSAEPRAVYRVVYDQTAAGTNQIPNTQEMGVDRVDGGQAVLSWETPNGCGYLVQYSADGVSWIDATGWFRATSRRTYITLSGTAAAAGNVYRLQLRP